MVKKALAIAGIVAGAFVVTSTAVLGLTVIQEAGVGLIVLGVAALL